MSLFASPVPQPAPMRLVEVELAQPLPDLSKAQHSTGRSYSGVLCLVRLHTQPLGLVELSPFPEALAPTSYAPTIFQYLRRQIDAHLASDSLPSSAALDSTVLASDDTPKCLRERADILANPPPISVIINTRDRPQLLANCLDALSRLAYSNHEIIVVDN